MGGNISLFSVRVKPSESRLGMGKTEWGTLFKRVVWARPRNVVEEKLGWRPKASEKLDFDVNSERKSALNFQTSNWPEMSFLFPCLLKLCLFSFFCVLKKGGEEDNRAKIGQEL